MSDYEFKPIAFGIHGHSDFSLDGAVSPKGRIKRAKELGRPADSLTDHGNMSGLIPHYYAAKEAGIQSVHGIELYLIDDRRPAKVYKNGKVEPQYTHQTVLFKTQKAYEYFCRMSPVMEERAVVKWGESKPLLHMHELEPIAGEIILGSGCLVSYVGKNINDFSLSKNQRFEWAEQAYLDLKKLSGETPLLVEIFPHATTHNWKKATKERAGFFEPILEKNHICSHDCSGVEHVYDECGHLTVPVDLQKTHNAFMIHLARKYNDLLVISEDSHLGSEADYEVQVQRMNNGKEKWLFHNKYAMMDSNFWATHLKDSLNLSNRDIEEMIDNSYKSLEFFKDYRVHTNKDGWRIPTAKQVYGDKYKGMTNKEIVAALIEKHGRMPSPTDPMYKTYKDRLDYEISVFADNGKFDLLPYFFPVEDVVEWAKSRGEVVTTRGSAGGSLLVYLLGKSLTDPIRYNLPFERMISLGRIQANTPPDEDTDWEDREPIIQYLFEKYGNSCSLISTEMSIKLKTSILDSERAALGEVRKETAFMVKQLSNPPQGVAFNKWLRGYTNEFGAHVDGFLDDKNDISAQKLRIWIEENPKIWATVEKCLGVTKTRGVHAGGVLITPEPVSMYAPILKTKKGMATALNMKYAENVGLIKYDFLGVSTLKAIGIALRAMMV
jgi:DNA polymerase-3 subunit alpha